MFWGVKDEREGGTWGDGWMILIFTEIGNNGIKQIGVGMGEIVSSI